MNFYIIPTEPVLQSYFKRKVGGFIQCKTLFIPQEETLKSFKTEKGFKGFCKAFVKKVYRHNISAEDIELINWAEVLFKANSEETVPSTKKILQRTDATVFETRLKGKTLQFRSLLRPVKKKS